MSDALRGEEPFDRLSRIANACFETASEHPEWEEDARLIVGVYSMGEGCLAHFGYDSDKEAVQDMIQHLAAVFEANGMQLVVAPMGTRIGRDQ
jgi:hypothetical protein